MASINSDLVVTPISSAVKDEIIKALWGPDIIPIQRRGGRVRGKLNFNPYFQFYTEQCMLALHDGSRHVSVKTHRHLLQLVQQLREFTLTRDAVRLRLELLEKELDRFYQYKEEEENEEDEKEECKEKKRDRSINLAARVLLMIDFGSLESGFSGRRELIWEHGTLKDFVHDYFSTPPALADTQVKLERIFNARNLYRIAGIKIAWTDNLADHLRMIDEDRKLVIFHHVLFLELQQDNPIFPEGFIDETLRTIALLFPQGDTDTETWYKKQLKAHPNSLHLDPRLPKCGQLLSDDRHIENFTFWRDRLVILKQAFDDTMPGTISQWWWDRRNGVQWYTFWVAIWVLILTVFFGVVQCVEGGIQTYKAFDS